VLARGKLVWAICFALLLVSSPLLIRDLLALRQGVENSSGADFWYTGEINRELLRLKITLIEANADWNDSSASRVRFQFDLVMSRLNTLPRQSRDGWHSQGLGQLPEVATLADDVARFDAASSLLDTDPPAYLELALNEVERALQDSRALSVKALERQNGLVGYLQVEFERFGIHLALYGAGLVALAVGLVYLMVRHMRSEGALRTADRGLVEKSALVEATLNSMSQGLCVVDTDWRLMAWNDHFLEQFEVAKGYARVGRPFADIIGNEAMGSGRGSEDALALLADWAERIGNSESHGFAYVRSNGRAIDIWGDPMPKGGYVYTFTDVTERRRAEQDIRESEERFRRLAEAVPQGIMVHFEGRILEANGNLGKLFGQPTDWLIGGDLRHLLTDDSWRSLTDQFERSEEGIAEVVGRRDDQSAFPLEVAWRTVPYRGDLAKVVSLFDISSRKLTAERLHQSQKLEAIGQLAGGVAHDFNNLLTIIEGFAKRALAKADDGAQVRSSLAEVVSAAEKAAGLTRQLLTFSRKRTIARDSVRISTLFDELAMLLRPVLGERIELVFLPPERDLGVDTDAGQLFQALVNLAINGRDAMESSGRLTVRAAAADVDEARAGRYPDVRPGRYVAISVADEGAGIDPEVMSRIFEPFFTTKEAGRGTGLGLPMVYGFVRQSNGFIDIDSAIGVGTTMTLYLPLSEPAAVASAEDMGGAAFRARGETILIVEDEDALRRLAKSILEELGYTVLTATDGIDAIEVDEDCEGRIDLLLADVVMPGLDGIGAAKAIVQRRPDIKVVFMSGYPSRGDLSRGDLPRGVPLLEKPFNAYSLARTLREALDGATGATETEAAAPPAPERYGT